MSFQEGTFNTIGKRKAQFGGNFPVWARVRELYKGGGTIDASQFAPGTVIGAGTMVKFNGSGKKVEIITANGVEGVKATAEVVTAGAAAQGSLDDVNGLIFEDVCIPEGCILATCAVVRAGRIYADRVNGGGIPKSVEKQLPMIEFVRED